MSVVHRLWRLLPAVARRAAMVRLTAAFAPRPDGVPPPMAAGLAVAGEFSRASGIGEAARLMATAAEQLGLPVWRIDVPPPVEAGCGWRVPVEAVPPPGVPLVMHVNPPWLPLASLCLPRGITRRRRIIGCWYWELPAVPPDWHRGARFAHDIWAPSRFTAAALEPLAPGRVRVVTPPVAASPPVPAHRDRASFGLPADAVITLASFNLASSFARKNPLAAIAAFRAACGDRSDRMLVLKVGHPEQAPADFVRIRDAAQTANIRLETRTFPTADSHALTACCDIVLSLHRSEGFGLVPAEAMLLGKPVIATGWSGNMDFMTADNAALVRYRLIPAQDDRSVYRGSVWAEPDINDAATHLRRLIDDPRARHALGAQARADARAMLTSASLAEALRGIGQMITPYPADTTG